MSYVGDAGQEAPCEIHVTKNAGSPAGGILSAPAVHVMVTSKLKKPVLPADDIVGAVAGFRIGAV